MKKLLLIFIGCLVCSVASAQYNYYKLSIGAGGGMAKAYGDLEKNFYKPTVYVSMDYLFTPFLSAGIEIQKGSLKGGDSLNVEIDPHFRQFTNSFTAFNLNGKVQLGQFVEFEKSNLLYHLRGFYVGTGIGFMSNKMKEVNRFKINPDLSNYKFPGEDKGTGILIPVNTGLSFSFRDKWGFARAVVEFNYQMNMVFGESMDGYNDPPNKFKNQHSDFYSLGSVKLKFNFGPEGFNY